MSTVIENQLNLKEGGTQHGAEQVRKELGVPGNRLGWGHYFPSRKEFLSVTCLHVQRSISSRGLKEVPCRCAVRNLRCEEVSRKAVWGNFAALDAVFLSL